MASVMTIQQIPSFSTLPNLDSEGRMPFVLSGGSFVMDTLRELPISDIKTTGFNYHQNQYTYDKGGFYLIFDNINKKGYVGKSMYLILRLKSHIHNAKNNKGLVIDKEMYSRINNFSFYEIATYHELDINFFTRQLEIIVEREFIRVFNTLAPCGYNQRI